MGQEASDRKLTKKRISRVSCYYVLEMVGLFSAWKARTAKIGMECHDSSCIRKRVEVVPAIISVSFRFFYLLTFARL